MEQKLAGLKPIVLEESEGLVSDILSKTKKGMGMIPNLYAGMANNAALLDAYTHAYHSFRENSGFTPQEQEVVFLSVSAENSCEYCVSAHSFIADKMSNLPSPVTGAIRNNTDIPDSKLKALSRFTRQVTQNRGRVSASETELFYSAGYNHENVLGVIAGVGIKTFSNYFNHLFDTPLDAAFAAHAWKPLS